MMIYQGIHKILLTNFEIVSHLPTFLTLQRLVEYEKKPCDVPTLQISLPAVPTLRINPSLLSYRPLDIPFPDGGLSPCSECSGNVRIKDCRQQKKHNGLPKTNTYICITMDSTCFAGDGSVLNEEFHLQLRSDLPCNSYVYPEQVGLSEWGPRCTKCKSIGYSSDHCRTKEKHRALPWTTAYVILTLANGTNQSMVPLPMRASACSAGAIYKNKSAKKENDAISNAPHPSMTFLAIVSSDRNEAMVRESWILY